MIDFLKSLGEWNWFILGGILLVVEVLAPGTFMLWLGLAAIAVGVISFFIDWTWQSQWITFAALALVFIPLWRRLGRRGEIQADQPFLNRRAEAFVGQEFTLEQPIVGGSGTVRIGDTVWRVTGPDCPAGSRIKVKRAVGAMLAVEPA